MVLRNIVSEKNIPEQSVTEPLEDIMTIEKNTLKEEFSKFTEESL